MTDEELAEERKLVTDVVDYVLPILPPYELKLYLFMLRRTHLADSSTTSVRLGTRTIAKALGRGTQSQKPNYQQVSKKLRTLEEAGFIVGRDTDRSGTLYEVLAPRDVPSVREEIAAHEPGDMPPPDHYVDPHLRQQLFERDDWRCNYCGELVTEQTATLDHVIPVSKGGPSEPNNLVVACLMCNSIKSGRTYEEAAPNLALRD